MAEERPTNVTEEDWKFFKRFERSEDELRLKREAMAKPKDQRASVQFSYVPGTSETTAKAVLE